MLSKTHLRAPLISKKFPGVIPRIPVKRGRVGEGKGMRGGQGRGAPPIHIPGCATESNLQLCSKL